MNVTGKALIFCKEVGKGEKKIKIFETSFSHKDKDGKYCDNVSCRVEFSKDFLPDEKKAAFKDGYAYPMEILEGFISTRGYETKEGKHKSEISIFVKNAKTTDKPRKVEKKEKPAQTSTDDGKIVGPDGEELPF